MIRVAIPAGIKAVAMTAAVATLAAREPFWHQVLLVLVSGGLTAAGLVFAAWIGARRVEERLDNHERRLAAMQGAFGASRRKTDHPE